jgi:hypothetical protein
MLKWWFLIFLRGIAMGGPYDNQQECLDALKKEMVLPFVDPGFDNAKPHGLCFQAAQPTHP